MKSIFIFSLFLNCFFFSISIVQNWDLASSSIDLLEGRTSLSIPEFVKTGYDMEVKLYKYIAKENNEVVYRKYLTVTNTQTSSVIYDNQVDIEKIDSFYYLNDKYIICPQGRNHPLIVYSYNGMYILDVGNNFAENGDWELKCYHHYTGYFLVFYLMNGNSQFFRTKTSGTFSWTRETFHNEIYDFKLNNGNSNGEYSLAYIVDTNGYLKLLGSKFTFNNDGVYRNDCGGENYLMNALTHTRGCFDNTYNHFYYLSYSDTSDFACGYYEENNLDYLSVGSITVNKNEDSPLEFVDEVEIQEIKFVNHYKYAYYKIYNPTEDKTYRGIIDTRSGLVVFNTDEDIITYVPYSDISMLAITSDYAYEICVIKRDGSCIDSYYGCSDTNYQFILDLQGNKCSSSCSDGKILLIRENFCSDTCDESIYILKDNQCGLCYNFYKFQKELKCIIVNYIYLSVKVDINFMREHALLIVTKPVLHVRIILRIKLIRNASPVKIVIIS